MRTYLVRRLLLFIPTLFLITVLTFLIMRSIPGNALDIMVAEMTASATIGTDFDRKALEHELGLDVPIHIAYVEWLKDAVRGDLGQSLWTKRNVTTDIIGRLPITIELGILALITAILVAIPIGVYSAIRQDTPGDYVGRTMGILAISLPHFWIATMVIVYASIWLRWSPSMEYIPLAKDVIGNLVQFIVPASILGLVMSGTTMRMTRTMMLEVLRQDYIRTAWAKGIQEKTIIIRHAVKNAFIPVFTIIGTMVPMLIGGSVIMEQIFALPGIGRYLIDALNKRDYPVISGVILTTATITLFVNIAVDLTYAYLDPRIKYK